MADLVLDKISLSEYNTGAEQVVESEKVETESGTLTVKEVDSKKPKAGLGTYPEKAVDSVKVKAGLGTLTGAKVAELRIVVDLTRVEPEWRKLDQVTHGLGNQEKIKAIAADNCTLNYVRGIANQSAPMQRCLTYS